jgi:membrane protease YdiL (CAAX protease family)
MSLNAKSTRWWVILLVLVVGAVLDFALMSPPAAELLRGLARGSHGVLLPPLVMNTVTLAIVVGGLIVWTGRLRGSDLGLASKKIVPALLMTLCLWLLLHALALGFNLAEGQPLAWDEQWSARSAYMLGRILADFLGVALCEEIVFRGFLLTQLRLKLDPLLGGRRWMALGLALGLSQVVFAIGHLPYLCYHQGAPWAELPRSLLMLFFWGILFALVYVRTGNLLISVGLHGLVNTPALLLEAPGSVVGTSIVLVPLFYLLVAWLRQWRAARSAAHVTAEAEKERSSPSARPRTPPAADRR